MSKMIKHVSKLNMSVFHMNEEYPDIYEYISTKDITFTEKHVYQSLSSLLGNLPYLIRTYDKCNEILLKIIFLNLNFFIKSMNTYNSNIGKYIVDKIELIINESVDIDDSYLYDPDLLLNELGGMYIDFNLIIVNPLISSPLSSSNTSLSLLKDSSISDIINDRKDNIIILISRIYLNILSYMVYHNLKLKDVYEVFE